MEDPKNDMYITILKKQIDDVSCLLEKEFKRWNEPLKYHILTKIKTMHKTLEGKVYHTQFSIIWRSEKQFYY